MSISTLYTDIMRQTNEILDIFSLETDDEGVKSAIKLGKTTFQKLKEEANNQLINLQKDVE
ncbi:hypothetical protein, partial [Acidithiobacillus ferridurans]|uniref:hypothetical protein n=1 Tax=Acidithiobacillus ferridurans TaxID=1232575 RepID=UPI001C077AD7